MQSYRLRDGLHRGHGRDPHGFERRLGLIHYYAPEGDPPGGGAGEPPADPPADPPDDDIDDVSKIDPEKFKKVLDDRRRKNKELQAIQKEREELAAKVKAYEEAEAKRKEADMTEAQKAAARAEKAEKELAEARALASKAQRINVMQAAGVNPKYVEYAQSELAAWQAANPKGDQAKWIEEWKAENVALLAGTTNAPATTVGPQGVKGGEAQAIAERIAELKKQPMISNHDAIVISGLEQQLERLQRKAAGAAT